MAKNNFLLELTAQGDPMISRGNKIHEYIILVSVLESYNKLLVLPEIHAPALSNDH
jgi:hypothetical protein